MKLPEWIKWLLEQKQILAAVISGVFIITGAYIRRDHHLEKTATKKPFARLLLTPLFYLILGMGLLATEFYYVNVNADRDMDLHNPGAILCLLGCLFVVGGVVWLPLNLLRLLRWPKIANQVPGEMAEMASGGRKPPDSV